MLQQEIASLLERATSVDGFLAAPAAELVSDLVTADPSTIVPPRPGRMLGSGPAPSWSGGGL